MKPKADQGDEGMITEISLLYPDREDVTLTTYIIADRGELHALGNRPAVLICPGGGYFNCSDREAEPVALAFAAMGYHAFVLRYSTWMEGREELPDFENICLKPHLAHPAPVREIGMAFMLIRKHCTAWKVDMKRIAVCGFSAGAHNTAMYGVYWNQPLVTEALGVDAEAIQPAAQLLCYPVTDYLFMKDNVKKQSIEDQMYFEGSTRAFLGKDDFTERDLYRISPSRLVTGTTPPTFLWGTSTDQMVPIQHTLRMAHALAEANVPFEAHIYEGGPHGLSLAISASATKPDLVNAHAAKWIQEANEWLKKSFGDV